MVKKILFAIFGCFALQAQAQILKPLAQGLIQNQGTSDEVIATTTDNDFMYVATRHSNGSNKQTVTINKWNGFYWQQLPGIAFSDDVNTSIKSIAVYNGQVYIGGSFVVKSPAITTTKTLVRFNTILNRWEAVTNNVGGGGFNFLGGGGLINSMVVYKNQLFIAGYFTTILDNDTTRNIIGYNGSKFYKCGLGNLSSTGTDGLINSLYVHRDSLFVGGSFTKAGGLNSPNFAYFTDSAVVWKAASFTSSGSSINKFASYQNSLVILANDAKMYLRNGTSMQIISNSLNYNQVTDLEEFNNELWVSGIFYFGGNPATIVKYSSGWSSSNLPNVNATNLFKYKNGLYLISTNDIAGNIRINRVAQIAFNQSRISGRVYQDVNHNCKYDDNFDKPFLNKVIRLSGNDNTSIKTDSNGYYSTYVNSGFSGFKVSLVKFKNWDIDSPCSRSSYSFTPNSNQAYDSLDFILKPTVSGADIRISLSPNGGFTSRRDYTEEYNLVYNNNGTTDISSLAGIELVFDKKLTNFTSVPAATVINGNKASWSFTNLKVGEQRSISFSTKVKADSFNVSEKINFIASSGYLADIDKTDNADTLVQQITQNGPTQVMKDVFPLPLANDSFSLISTTANEINYLIHFENTSLTDTIHTVIVIDTIDINSTIEYTQETGASHPYTTKLYNCPPAMGKGVLVWTFANINLPPFENNDDVSNRGHIGFKIKFNQNLPLGTILKNKAHVVFDYYDPMKTNNTYAKVSDLTGINSLNKKINFNEKICQNPVNSIINLFRNYEAKSSYRIISSSGALIQAGNIDSKAINVSTLAQGIYFLMIEENSLLTSQKIIIY